MKQGISQLRNPVIARVFRELELVEQWGCGIPGIFRQAAAAKLPEPVLRSPRRSLDLPPSLEHREVPSRISGSHLQVGTAQINLQQDENRPFYCYENEDENHSGTGQAGQTKAHRRHKSRQTRHR